LDPWIRQVPGLLPRDDLYRLHCWGPLGLWRPGYLVELYFALLQVLPNPQREVFRSEVNGLPS